MKQEPVEDIEDLYGDITRNLKDINSYYGAVKFNF